MRVVPPPDMVAYLERLGALEQRARAAAVAPVSPAPAWSSSAAAPCPSRRHLSRGLVASELGRWIAALTNRAAAACREWVRAMVSALTMLLVIVAATTPSAAQEQENKPGASTKVATMPARPASRPAIDAVPLGLWSVEREVDRLELDRGLRQPILLVIPESDWRLLAGLVVGYGALGCLSLVAFMRSRIGEKVGAAVAKAPRRVFRLFCRKPTCATEVQTGAPAARNEPASAGEPPVYRSTRSDDDPSDPLINCWLERLDASLRLKGAAMLPDQTWSTDLRGHRGNVRSRNEDFALGFRFHEHDVVLVADGCGGVPCGFQASRIAACAAAVKLVEGLPGTATDPTASEDAMRKAFTFASAQLADAARLYAAPDDERVRLQTTLLVAAASSSSLTIAYIGDGGAVLVRPDEGTETRVLLPMKEAGGAPNILAAVLGPQTLGEPSINTIERRAGDLLLIGTDGIWDFVPESFSKQFMREAVMRGGRVGETLDAALALLAGHQDELGHVCTDNLTLAVVAPDRCAPKFGPGYWAAAAVPSVPAADARAVEEVVVPC